ncbi:MAG: VanW family protein, partial [Bacillota bacterium]
MKLMKIMLLALGVLVVAMIVVLIVMLAQGGPGKDEKQDAFVQESTYLNGISIAGVDISGQTYEQAAANEQLKSLSQQIEDTFSYSFTVNGTPYTFRGTEIGVTSNLEPLLKEAMLYGQYGGEAGAQKRELNENGGKNFDLIPYGDYEAVMAKLIELKASTLDKMPQDAALQIADGVLGEERFSYTDAVVGVDVDASVLATIICTNLANGNYSSVEAPAILTNPKVSMEELKANTKLIGSYTSIYKDISTEARITNIRLMSGFVNGVIIQPGETWSINAEAGPRNAQTAAVVGWAEAHGITNGRYEDQYGGGVCQVSGTLYNAAIRAELGIAERHTHSWPSTYVPEGLDATINYPSGELDSPGTKDLKLTNPFDMPVYLAAYLDEEAETLTIEVYGPPSLHGYTVEFITI